MLVLGRKPRETIVVEVPPSDVPQRIEVVVVGTRKNNVRLGIDAPRECNIVRGELRETAGFPTSSPRPKLRVQQD